MVLRFLEEFLLIQYVPEVLVEEGICTIVCILVVEIFGDICSLEQLQVLRRCPIDPLQTWALNLCRKSFGFLSSQES